MEITEVRIKLHNRPADRLKAYCTISFDEVFVVREVKIVEGTRGLFVAMPSRKLAVPCHKCRYSNALRARYCSSCGVQLSPHPAPVEAGGRTRLHRDVAHPITGAFREYVQTQVLEAYRAEEERAQEPEYVAPVLDLDSDADVPVNDGVDGDDPQRSEPVSDASPSEPDAQPSEYDILIADLRGGAVSETRPGDDSSEARTGGSRPRSERKESHGRGGRRGGTRPKRGGTPERSRSRPPEPERDVPEQVAVDETPTDHADDDAFGAGIGAPSRNDGRSADVKPKPREPAADRVDLDEAVKEPSQRDDVCEDSSAFGAGII